MDFNTPTSSCHPEESCGSMAVDRAINAFPFLVLFFAIAVVLICFFALMFYSWPVSDDYVRASWDTSLYASLARSYSNWSARLTSHALQGSVLPRISLVVHYPILIIVLGLLQLQGLYLLWRILLDSRRQRITSLVLAFGTLAILWSGMPSVAHSVYWFTGAVENQLPSTLVILLVWGAVKLAPIKKWSVHWWGHFLGLVTLCLAITGMHELYAVALCGVLAVATVISVLLPSQKTTGVWVALLGAALIGASLVVSAPGNMRRAEITAEGRENMPTTLTERFRLVTSVTFQEMKRVVQWFVDPRLLAMSVVLVLSPQIMKRRPDWYRKNPVLWKWTVPSATAILVFFTVAIPCWALCASPAGRTLGLAYTVFLLGWSATLFIWTRPTSELTDHGMSAPITTLLRGAMYTAAIALLATGNGRAAMRDLIQGDAKESRKAMVERDVLARLRKAQGEAHINFSPLPRRPESFRVWGDIISDKTCPRNQAVAKYYGLESVSLAPDGVEEQ
jgi:hypothetical protein